MEVILLEKVRNLGDIGAKVAVKSGHARNFLIPYGKAVVATAANLEKFAKMRAELEKNAAEALNVALARKDKLDQAAVSISMKATEEGKLFGSVNTSMIAHALKDIGFDVERKEVSMPQGPIRQVGEYEITLLLHTDVTVKIKVNVVAIKEE